MTLDLEDPDGGKEKLGQICAVFTVQPKNFEDRQEVLVFCLLFFIFQDQHWCHTCLVLVTNRSGVS